MFIYILMESRLDDPQGVPSTVAVGPWQPILSGWVISSELVAKESHLPSSKPINLPDLHVGRGEGNLVSIEFNTLYATLHVQRCGINFLTILSQVSLAFHYEVGVNVPQNLNPSVLIHILAKRTSNGQIVYFWRLRWTKKKMISKTY